MLQWKNTKQWSFKLENHTTTNWNKNKTLHARTNAHGLITLNLLYNIHYIKLFKPLLLPAYPLNSGKTSSRSIWGDTSWEWWVEECVSEWQPQFHVHSPRLTSFLGVVLLEEKKHLLHYMCASRSIKVSVKRVHVYMCTPTYQRVYHLCQCLHPWWAQSQ
jgi:hypothetical protein